MLVNVGVGFNDDVRVLRQHLIRVGVDETIKTTIYIAMFVCFSKTFFLVMITKN